MPAMVVIAPWSWTSLHWRTRSAAAAVTPLNARTSDAGYTQRPRRTSDRSSTIATAAPASAISGETASPGGRGEWERGGGGEPVDGRRPDVGDVARLGEQRGDHRPASSREFIR